MTSFSADYYRNSREAVGCLLSHMLLALRWLMMSFSICVWGQRQQQRHHCRSRQTVAETLQVATYGEISDQSSSSSSATCAVCLSELCWRDHVWELRNCRHVFHKACLDRWLDHDDNLTCPLCRAPILDLLSSASNTNHTTVAGAAAEPSWAVDRIIYLFADDMLPPCNYSSGPLSLNTC